MNDSQIRDIDLWESGQKKIEWVKQHMPLLSGIEAEFSRTKPLAGIRMGVSIHLEAKTAYLCHVLRAAGASLAVTGCNPLSTQDDVAAALAHDGFAVYAWYNATDEEYRQHIFNVVKSAPNLILDDGGDLVNALHNHFAELIPNLIGGCEETTTGINRLKAMDRDGQLRFPMMLVNNAKCKHFFDNRYGTGQSVWDGINRTTNLIVAGKNVVVSGYGWCGKGVAMRAKGLGAHVIITETDPVRALEAHMDGFSVMKMLQAALIGDIFITVTGCAGVIGQQAFALMKDGAILCNAGHFDVEIDLAALNEMAVEVKEGKPNIVGYTMKNGNRLYVLADGRLVNLAAGDGHPAEIMDMSFAIQALCMRYLVENKENLKDKILYVPEEIDHEVALRKLAYSGIEIDALSKAQEEYLNSWNH